MSQFASFVGRTRQMAQLNALLDRAVAGQGQICFVTGDAGAGKSVLAAHFLRQAEARHAALVAAVALGDPQTGAGDPYLIFRDVLAQLTGDVEARLAQGAITPVGALRVERAVRTTIDCLVEYGPDLIGLLVPGAGLALKLTQLGIDASKRAGLLERLTQMPAAARPDATGGRRVDQGQIFEQYVKVLKALSRHAPLLLILDDMQWADSSSIDLLFHLARRIEGSPICVLACYRPAELAHGRAGQPHPLERVVSEIKRYYGDVVIDLDTAARSDGQAFADQLLDSAPNRLGAAFRAEIVARTGGNPLFMVELLREMQADGDIVRAADGAWQPAPDLDWNALPARAEGVIEARISRLSADLVEALKLASVQGEAFTAEVVAQIRNLNIRDFVRQLGSELERRHRLVSAQGQQRIGDQRLSQYQFQNRLFQQYLYQALDATERAYLHEDIGRALETLYGTRADEAAARLAYHFEQAGVGDKALHYLHAAGDQALAQSANHEALDYYTRALALVPDDAATTRFALLLGRVRAGDRLGQRDLQAADVPQLLALATQLGDDQRYAQAALQLALLEDARQQYAAVAAAAQQSFEAAQRAGDNAAAAAALLQIAASDYRLARYDAAQENARRALALAEAGGHTRQIAESLYQLGGVANERGQNDAALDYLTRARALFASLPDGESGAALATDVIASVYFSRGDYAQARTLYQQALDGVRRAAIVPLQTVILNNLGGVAIATGELHDAIALYDEVLALAQQTGDRFNAGAAHVNLSNIRRSLGDAAAAQAHAEQALAIFSAINSPYGELHALLQLGSAQAALGAAEQALDSFARAATLAAAQDANALAQAAAAGRADVLLRRGDPHAARAALEPLLNAADGPADSEQLLAIYATCHAVLSACDDPRAPALLATAFERLQAQLANLPDEPARLRFLNNVPHNRAIWRAATGRDPQPAAPPAAAAPAAAAPAAAAPAAAAPAVEAPAAELPPAAALPVVAPPQPRRPLRGRLSLAFAALTALLLLGWWTFGGGALRGCPPLCAGRSLAGRNWPARTLVGADLTAADLRAATLSGADLTAARLVSSTLAAADLRAATLTAALLNGVDATGADFDAATLRGADLQGADLRGATLVDADLTSADLRGARLAGGDLRGATLVDADLRGADLRAARLEGADLAAARHDATTRWPHGFAPPAAPP